MLLVDDAGLEAALDTARGVSSEQKAQIRAYLQKYLQFFGATSTPRIEIKDNVGSKWLGRTYWRTSQPENTIIELQRSILVDPRTLERVVAHEIVHHVEMTTMSQEDIDKFRVGIRPREHGERFTQLAQKINHAAGEDFVTEKSDVDYVITSTKNFYLLIVPAELLGLPKGRYAFSWNAGAPRSVRTTNWVRSVVHNGARLVKTNHREFTRGPKFGQGKWGVPREKDEQDLLRQIYEQAAS